MPITLRVQRVNNFVRRGLTWTLAHWVSKLKRLLRIIKFFHMDFTVKINVKKEPRFDRSTVIFKFRSKYSRVFSQYLISLFTIAYEHMIPQKTTCFGLPDGTFFEPWNDHKTLL